MSVVSFISGINAKKCGMAIVNHSHLSLPSLILDLYPILSDISESVLATAWLLMQGVSFTAPCFDAHHDS